MTTAPGFSAIVGQPHAIRRLKTFLVNETLPHALLFSGDDGVGKKTCAIALAMACNCLPLQAKIGRQPEVADVDACGECLPCRKIAGHQHPDVIRVAPAGSMIKIAQIRGLLRTLALKPNEAERRVVILSEAHCMNPEAANALLKVLEEPPDRTLLVLTARRRSDLLPTIVSRCRQIRFPPLDPEAVKQLLTRIDGVADPVAETVAGLCGGSVVRAQQLIDGRWLRRREWIVEALTDRMADSDPADLRFWLTWSEMLAREKDAVDASLQIIALWLRDMLVALHAPQLVSDQERRELLIATARRFGQVRLIEQVEAVQSASAALRSNTNLRLTLDAMALQMAGACG